MASTMRGTDAPMSKPARQVEKWWCFLAPKSRSRSSLFRGRHHQRAPREHVVYVREGDVRLLAVASLEHVGEGVLGLADEVIEAGRRDEVGLLDLLRVLGAARDARRLLELLEGLREEEAESASARVVRRARLKKVSATHLGEAGAVEEPIALEHAEEAVELDGCKGKSQSWPKLERREGGRERGTHSRA